MTPQMVLRVEQNFKPDRSSINDIGHLVVGRESGEMVVLHQGEEERG